MPPKATNGAKARQEEQQARNELFDGADEINIDPSNMPLEEQSNRQIVDTAMRTHKETTAAAQRALKTVKETQQIQAQTLADLHAQEQTMDRIGNNMDNIHAELSYAEKLLNYMRRCCCCWWCDSCTGADPEERRKRQFAQRVERGETQAQADRRVAAARAEAAKAEAARKQSPGRKAAGQAPPEGPVLPDPNVNLPAEFRKEEMAMHEETRKQNAVIEEINQGLDGLLQGAKDMEDTLGRQNAQLAVMDTQAETVRDRIKDVNTNSQLRNLARDPPKTKGDAMPSILPTKTGAAAAAAKRLAGL